MALSENLRGALYMTAAMASFAANDAFMKTVTGEVPLFQAIAMRGIFTVAGLALLVALTAEGRFGVPRAHRGPVALRSLFEFASTVTFLAALMHMPLPNLSAIFQALPLAVTLVAALLFRERIGWRRLTAIGLGAVGVLIVIRPGFAGFDAWSLMALASVAMVVVRDLATRSVPASVPTVTVAFWAAMTVLVGTGAAALGQGLDWPTSRHLGLCFGAAVFLLMGYLTVIPATRTGEVGFVAPYRYTALIFALILGWAVFGDWPDAVTLVGAAVVVGSGIFTIWREARLRVKPVAGRVDIPPDSA